MPCADTDHTQSSALSLHHPWHICSLCCFKQAKSKSFVQMQRFYLVNPVKARRDVSQSTAKQQKAHYNAKSYFSFAFFPWDIPPPPPVELALCYEPGDRANQQHLQSFLSSQQTPYLCCVGQWRSDYCRDLRCLFRGGGAWGGGEIM